MKLAIQEDMLPGRTLKERYLRAADLGFDGVELWSDGLDKRLYDVAEALNEANLPVAAVNLGKNDGYLSPDMAKREAAIGYMRQAMATAVDFRAPHVIFVPHWGELVTPDLTPHRSDRELANDLMVWFLRTVSDLAYALGTRLEMQPRNHYETDFMNTVAQAVHFSDVIKDNPHVRIAAHLFDMALEEDVVDSLQQYHDRVGYIHLSDSNCRLPGEGLLDFAAIAETLHDNEYDGWVTLSAGNRGKNAPDDYSLYDRLPACLEHLKAVGLLRR